MLAAELYGSAHSLKIHLQKDTFGSYIVKNNLE